MAEFLIAYKLTTSNEGDVLTDDPNDSGGLSYGGLSKKNNPTWDGWGIIIEQGIKPGQTCPQLEASKQKWYKTHYWDTLSLDTFPDQDLANQVYDTAVNQGVGTAKELLKEAQT